MLAETRVSSASGTEAGKDRDQVLQGFSISFSKDSASKDIIGYIVFYTYTRT